MTNMPMTTMNSNPLFSYEGHDIRTIIDENGEPWFVAKDVAEVLGYVKPENAIAAHCKAANTCPLESGGQVRHMTIIPERDVYRLVMRSKLPTAEKFEEWVVGTVLPSIRKHGGYLTPAKIEEVLANPDTIIRLATDLKQARAKIEADAPKVAGFDVFMNSKDSVTFTEVAKVLGLSGKELCARLRGKYLTEDRNAHGQHNNYPRPEYLARGWFIRTEKVDAASGAIRGQTRVTPRGADEIRKLVEEGKL